MQFTDTAEPLNPANLLPTPGLVMMKLVVGGESSYVAPLEMLSPPRINPPADFEPWWNKDVTKDKDGNLWSRKSFVLTLANKEGGAHVDPDWTRCTKPLSATMDWDGGQPRQTVFSRCWAVPQRQQSGK